MLCTNCGKEIDNASTSCPHCGNVYPEITPDSEMVLRNWRKARPFASFLDKYGEKHLKWLFKIMGAIVLAFFFIKVFTSPPLIADSFLYISLAFLFAFLSEAIDGISPVVAGKSLWKYILRSNYKFYQLYLGACASNNKATVEKYVYSHLYSNTPKLTIIYLSELVDHFILFISQVCFVEFFRHNLNTISNLPNNPSIIFNIDTYNHAWLLFTSIILFISYFVFARIRASLLAKEMENWKEAFTEQSRKYGEEKRKETEVNENTLDGKTKDITSEHSDTKI